MKTIIFLAFLAFFAGCGNDNPVNNVVETDRTDNSSIYVSITDNTGHKLYSEYLPLIYVQQLREITTNGNGQFIFNFDIPDNWSLTFESSVQSFVSIKSGSVPLNFDNNNYYQFAITTQ